MAPGWLSYGCVRAILGPTSSTLEAIMVIHFRHCQKPSKNTPPKRSPQCPARINAATTPKHKNSSKTLSPVALQARRNEKSSKPPKGRDLDQMSAGENSYICYRSFEMIEKYTILYHQRTQTPVGKYSRAPFQLQFSFLRVQPPTNTHGSAWLNAPVGDVIPSTSF